MEFERWENMSFVDKRFHTYSDTAQAAVDRWAAMPNKPPHDNPKHIPWSIPKLKGRYHLRHIHSWCPIPGTQIAEETAEKEEHDRITREIAERAAAREEKIARKGRARAVAMPQKEAIMSAYGKGNVPTQIDACLFEKKARVEQMEKERRAPAGAFEAKDKFESKRNRRFRALVLANQIKYLETFLARNREMGNAINIDMICDEEDPGGSDDDTGPRIAVKKDHRVGYEDVGGKDKSRKGGSHEGNSALLIAAENGNVRLAKVLLEFGAKPDQQNNVGYYPVHQIFKRLVGPVWTRGTYGMKQLRKLNPLLRAVYQDNALKILKLLVQFGASVNSKTFEKYTPLHFCAMFNMQEACVILLKHGAKSDERNLDGKTALDIAVRRKHVEIVRLINTWPRLKEHFKVSEFHQEWRAFLADEDLRIDRAMQMDEVERIINEGEKQIESNFFRSNRDNKKSLKLSLTTERELERRANSAVRAAAVLASGKKYGRTGFDDADPTRRKKFEYKKRKGAAEETPDDQKDLSKLDLSFWQRRVRTAAKHLRQDVYQADDARRPASTSVIGRHKQRYVHHRHSDWFIAQQVRASQLGKKGPVVILQSTFLDWTPCFSQPWPGFSFPRIALPFHDRFHTPMLYREKGSLELKAVRGSLSTGPSTFASQAEKEREKEALQEQSDASNVGVSRAERAGLAVLQEEQTSAMRKPEKKIHLFNAMTVLPTTAPMATEYKREKYRKRAEAEAKAKREREWLRKRRKQKLSASEDALKLLHAQEEEQEADGGASVASGSLYSGRASPSGSVKSGGSTLSRMGSQRRARKKKAKGPRVLTKHERERLMPVMSKLTGYDTGIPLRARLDKGLMKGETADDPWKFCENDYGQGFAEDAVAGNNRFNTKTWGLNRRRPARVPKYQSLDPEREYAKQSRWVKIG